MVNGRKERVRGNYGTIGQDRESKCKRESEKEHGRKKIEPVPMDFHSLIAENNVAKRHRIELIQLGRCQRVDAAPTPSDGRAAFAAVGLLRTGEAAFLLSACVGVGQHL
ncbi:hypothetical protein EVAR_6635_1 [Eumeta japonica]|uniref:Uncharacterized protein n=1 Tax=Eumeta variegata TaxID=151549 RepID=A0A4C1TN61_EUMVA|nr:hypothetical protein EVAR_6635_1 [Eumeta japonica]